MADSFILLNDRLKLSRMQLSWPISHIGVEQGK